MIDSADVVVVGAGAFGASVAWHLVRSTELRVAVLDKGEPVAQTTPRAAGLSSCVQPTSFLRRMATSSVTAIKRFEEETGESLPFHQTGSLKIARSEAHAERLRREVAAAQAAEVEVSLVNTGDVHDLSTFIETDPIVAASYTPADLYFDPPELPQAYLRAAQRQGASVLPQTRVTGIRLHHGAVKAVETDRGDIRTPIVVDTAGAWSALVGDMARLRVPVVPTRHQLFITEAISNFPASHPIVRLMDVTVYIRPCDDGVMLGGYEPIPAMFDTHTLGTDFDVANLELDFSTLQDMVDQVVDVMPLFSSFDVRIHRGGLPTMTADGNPLLGPLPDIEGFYILSGCCVGGLAKSPAMGKSLARWIINGHPDDGLEPAMPGRFAGHFAHANELINACRWQYAHHYDKAERK